MPKPEPKHKHLPYRPEVDGLRALAVIPVILFHAGFKLFGGGYVGVDVFFVISGFLITSIILAEMQAGTFTLAHFYERRVRRILPALFVVMAFCLIPAYLWMLPEQLKRFGHSLVAVPLFSSNLLFLKETGYFAPSNLEKPLLHTWSLAVEEQYYVAFPLFVILFYRFGIKKLSALLGIVLVASLCFSEYLLVHQPSANFYLAPPRAWELLTGALFALAAAKRPLYERFGDTAAQLLSLFGLAAIGVSIFIYTEATPFPGLYAVVPVLGAALVLGFAHRGTAVGRLLSLPPIVGTGLISYSLYLWHQPLFAFARLYSISSPSPVAYLGLCGASFFLAYLTWRLVENPLRNKEKLSRRQVFAGALILSLMFIAIGIACRSTKGFPQRFTSAQLEIFHPAESKLEDSHFESVPDLKELSRARLGAPDVTPDTILFGDSHAKALAVTFDAELKKKNRAAFFLMNGACESIPNMYSSISLDRINRDCPGWQKKLVDYIKADAHIKNIVVVMRWTYRLYPIRGAVESLTYNNGEGGIETDDYREYYALGENGKFTQEGAAKSRTVREFLRGFVSTGKKVIVLYPIPEAGWNIPQLAYKNMMRGRHPGMVSTSYERFLDRNKYADELLDSISAPNLVKIHPSDVLCNVELKGRCAAQIGDTPLYFDDDHLSTAGAERVVKQIMGALR